MRTKFNVSADKGKREFNGEVFDSELELRYYKDRVLPRLESGEITRCERQVKFVLQPAFQRGGKTVLPIEYKADFVLAFSDGSELVVDIKGFADPQALLKRKMFWYVYPDIEYLWIGWSKPDGGWAAYEEIIKGRKARKKLKTKTSKEKQNKMKKD